MAKFKIPVQPTAAPPPAAPKVKIPPPPTPPPPVVETKAKPHLPIFNEGKEVKLPPMECSTCYIQQDCPEYREGYVCAFEGDFKTLGVSTTHGALGAMEAIIQQNLKRLQFAFLAEQTISGGQTSADTTRLSETVMGQLRQFTEFKRQTQTITVTGSVKAMQSSGGSILGRLFGAGAGQPSDPILNGNPLEETVTVSLKNEGGDGS